MPGKKIFPDYSPQPMPALSPGMKAGNTVYVSGMCSRNSKGEMVGEGDIKAQTEQVIQNISDILEAAGASLNDVVMNQVFITDMKNYAGMNEVYCRHFSQNPPARYCVKSDLMQPFFLVEIASIAVIGND